MTRTSAYCYSLSATAMACIIGSVSATGFWDGRGVVAFGLGFTVPACVLSGWLLEHKPGRRKAWHYQITGYAGVVIGSVALAGFILSISSKLASGFGLGVVCIFFGLLVLDDLTHDKGTK